MDRDGKIDGPIDGQRDTKNGDQMVRQTERQVGSKDHFTTL
jgi:hypothetical protein